MSTNAGAPTQATTADLDEYDDKLADIEAVIDWIDEKLESGRIRDPDRAKARQGYLRLKLKALGEWRRMKEAGDLEELTAEVERLKAKQEGDL